MTLFKAFAAVLAGAGLWLQAATAHSIQRNPLSSVLRLDDAVIQTPSHRVHALSSFEVTFGIPDKSQKVRFVLDPNHDILSTDATVQILGADGTLKRIEPIDRLEHRIFRGHTFVKLKHQSEWRHAGWARINVHHDGSEPIFEGAFSIDGMHHHVQTDTNYRRTMIPGDPEIAAEKGEYMILWRDSEITEGHAHDDLKRNVHEPAGCSSDELLYNRDENNILYRSLDASEVSPWSLSPKALFGRQMDGTPGGNGAGVNLANSIGSTAGCPSTRKVALVGIATDCTYTTQFATKEAVRQNIIQQVNTASQLYESTFNISLGIQNLTISEAECPGSPPATAPWNRPCSGSTTITDRLNMFSAWRSQWKDNNAYWTLLTTCPTGSAVGLAWLGQVCQIGTTSSSNETIAGANVVVRTSQEWLVFAHETGHTFGAVHDCNTQSCSDGSVTKQQCCPLQANSCNAGGKFIMNPSTGSGITNFSPCSIGNICSFLARYSSRVTCLANNRDVPTITGSQCGNGIVEQGEECDCGGAQGCGGNRCCNPTTCKFTDNSVCDPSNEECCSQQCQFKSAGTVCRASTGSCDPEETCSGTTPNCPADKSADDGTSCGDAGNGLQCASGRCTSRDQQCKTLMGSLTTNNDTYSCSSQGCILSCSSPQFPRNTCYTMQQFFLDGTPCEGGGKCSNGNCQGANLGKQISSWFTENQNIVIPVASVVGGLILLAILGCCISSFRRRRRGSKVPTPPQAWGYGPMPTGPGGVHAAGAVPPPYPYPGAGSGMPQQMQQNNNGRWEPLRTRSFRYA